MGMMKEFKEFALKGNVLSMAVGIVIGIAFGKVINSLVADVIMPPIGLLLGNADFSQLAVTLRGATTDANGNAVAPVLLKYGAFINTVIEFLIVAFSIFLVLRVVNRLIPGAVPKEAPAAPSGAAPAPA